ncbi:Uncharacterized protein dnl_46880 [Desulfonema limicola]|uniref:Uncharacterized protein n=1 Tax=Desulfonema limicola TaxID=45656 RepID=A0A975BBQ0_9BACT|nr:hypothetical protein [Desulfonema limicola]QTA82314.1 Uncharacterized protein dnl_46880 [Desulfonema limicola]
MEKLKIEIKNAAKKAVKDFLTENFDEIVMYNKTLSAKHLFSRIDNLINIDVEEYLMNKACQGKTFEENEEIPEHDLAIYQKRFEEYGIEYERLKKQVIKPVHQDYKAKIAELRQEYLGLEKKYCEYFDLQNNKAEPKTKGVLSIIDKWRKPKPGSD